MVKLTGGRQEARLVCACGWFADVLRRHLRSLLDQHPKGEGRRDNRHLFGFLSGPPNAEVGAVHPKATPVILRRPEEWQDWLILPWPDA